MKYKLYSIQYSLKSQSSNWLFQVFFHLPVFPRNIIYVNPLIMAQYKTFSHGSKGLIWQQEQFLLTLN